MKKRVKQKIKSLKAEIDQSGKIEHLGVRTVIAIANHEKRAVMITSGEKIKLVRVFRKSVLAGKDYVYVIFASLVFILAKDIKELSMLIIDEEYTGQEKFIAQTLNKLYLRYRLRKKPEFKFGRIGKSSPAHDYAIYTYRKKKGFVAEKVKAEDILKLWEM